MLAISIFHTFLFSQSLTLLPLLFLTLTFAVAIAFFLCTYVLSVGENYSQQPAATGHLVKKNIFKKQLQDCPTKYKWNKLQKRSLDRIRPLSTYAMLLRFIKKSWVREESCHLFCSSLTGAPPTKMMFLKTALWKALLLKSQLSAFSFDVYAKLQNYYSDEDIIASR